MCSGYCYLWDSSVVLVVHKYFKLILFYFNFCECHLPQITQAVLCDQIIRLGILVVRCMRNYRLHQCPAGVDMVALTIAIIRNIVVRSSLYLSCCFKPNSSN